MIRLQMSSELNSESDLLQLDQEVKECTIAKDDIEQDLRGHCDNAYASVCSVTVMRVLIPCNREITESLSKA